MRQRRRFSPEFKARVVLAVCRDGLRQDADEPRGRDRHGERGWARGERICRETDANDQAGGGDPSGYGDFGDAPGGLRGSLEEVYDRERVRSPLGYLTPAEFEGEWREERS